MSFGAGMDAFYIQLCIRNGLTYVIFTLSQCALHTEKSSYDKSSTKHTAQYFRTSDETFGRERRLLY
jgi:hypothetical protein